MTDRGPTYSLRVRAKEDCNTWLRKGHVYDARPWDSHGMETALIVGCDVPRSFPKTMLEIVPDDTPLGPPLEKAGQWYGVWLVERAAWCTMASLKQYGSREEAMATLDAGRDLRNNLTYQIHEYTDGSPPKGPAAAAVCDGCKSAVCDCEKEIWTYWWRVGGVGGNEYPRTRAVIARQRAGMEAFDKEQYDTRTLRGPVQRITDPPHDFGKTSGAVRSSGDSCLPAGGGPEEPAFSSAALARALFDEELEDEAKRVTEWGGRGIELDAADRHVARALRIMWDTTKPDVRKRAEGIAARVCARLGRKP